MFEKSEQPVDFMRYVVALGGNALQNIDRQLELKRELLPIAQLYVSGNEVVITHGNGPQVGELANLEAKNLAVLTAQTQAEIGTKLQTAMTAAIDACSGSRTYKRDATAVVLSRAVIDPGSGEFRNPTKPIGRFYGASEAARIKSSHIVIKKLHGGYRRVVPSPPPKDIIEAGTIKELLSDGHLVIACGGGGIAVSTNGNAIILMDAVIDKDRTSSLLARKIDADAFFILTNVKGAYVNYGKRGQSLIKRTSLSQMERYLDQGHFEQGSMYPKVEACLDFVRATGNTAVIGNITNAGEAFAFGAATVIGP
ncbi:MAG: carbamate kinase [Candidatus Micrarchaeota archaeon]|nr:carbamate kinase [Candidatus Micrarchaeota archaeon]